MSAQLEHREYGPESTEEELALIRARIYMYKPNVVYWHEVPVMSVWQVERCGEKLEELTSALDSFSILIDLTDSKPPNAAGRAALRGVLSPLQSRVKGAAAFTGKNFFINVAAKFVLGGAGLNFSVHTQQKDAEQALEIS